MTRVLLYVPSHREIPEARESWIKQKAPDTWVDLFIMRYDPYPDRGPYDNLDVKSERARRMCLEGEYDYLFTVEDDIVLPDNALELLLKENAQVISGMIRCRWETSGDCRLSGRILDIEGPQDSDDRPLELEDIKHWGEIIECTGVSYGCLLIHKDLLGELEGIMGRDYEISKKLYSIKGSLPYHTGVLCGHVDENGNIIGVRTHGKLSPYRSFDLSP